MKSTLLLALTFCFTNFSFSQSPSLAWAYQLGQAIFGQESSITSDSNGDIYVIGSFTGALDLDPGPGVVSVTSLSHDFYIQKLDPNGNLIWAKSYGGIGGEYVYDIEIDVLGNIFVSGSFTQTTDLDPGPGVATLTAIGMRDLFILKLNPSGDFIWAKSLGSTTWTYGFSCDTDAAGNVFVAGQFESTMDFDPGVGVYNLTSNGDADIFILKLDSSGDFVWAHSQGSLGYDFAKDVVIDNSQNVLLTGRYDWTVDFDPGPAIYNLTVTLFGNSFIQKLDNDGNFIWAKSMEGGSNTAHSIVIDDVNNVYVTGDFRDTIDLDPNAGSAVFSSVINTTNDLYAVKLDSLGDFIWGWSNGALIGGWGASIDVDDSGNTYITGAHGLAIYILKLDQNGDMVWNSELSNSYANFGNEIYANNSGNVYVVGLFDGTIDLDPGPITNNFTALGSNGNFVLKLDTCIAISTVDAIVSCDSYAWIDGNTYTSSNNIATQVYPGSLGCDSVVTLNLTINNSDSVISTIYTCNSYTWIDGNTYTTNTNTPTWTLTNSAGCDSTLTLDLIINYSTAATDVIVACDTYTWIDGVTYTSSTNTPTWILTNLNGCDSILTLDLTVNYSDVVTDAVTACDSYTWIDGLTYISSTNAPTWVLTNINGCDSVITLNLSMNNVVSTLSQVNELTLSATNAGANYQWLDCDDLYAPLSGETNQLFIATVNGNYAVQVSMNGCFDTSACVLIDQVGFIENTFGSNFIVYPNPTSGELKIDLGEKYATITASVINAFGQKIATERINSAQLIELQIEGVPGIYIVEIETENRKARVVVVKE